LLLFGSFITDPFVVKQKLAKLQGFWSWEPKVKRPTFLFNYVVLLSALLSYFNGQGDHLLPLTFLMF